MTFDEILTQIIEQIQTALRMAQELNHPLTHAYALLIAPRFYIWRRAWALAIAHANSLLALADAHGFGQLAANGLMYHGYALAKQGDIQAEVARMQERNARAYLSTLIGHGYHRLLCCDVDALLGQRERALWRSSTISCGKTSNQERATRLPRATDSRANGCYNCRRIISPRPKPVFKAR